MSTRIRPNAGRATTYERVSVDKRDTRRSVTEQHADNIAIIAREGWTAAGSFVDNDRSASRFARKQRPGFVALVDHVRAGGCDVVVVWELSRLSRDLGTLVAFRDACRERGVLWSVGGRTYDPGDDRDTWPLIAQAIQAENESAQTSKRVLRTTVTTAQAGRPHGRVTYGYRREYDPTSKAFVAQVVDDDQAAVLREVASRFLAGEAFYTIARDLTARGVPAPSGGATWHPTNLSRLLRNPAYVARRMHRGQYVADAVWPALFTEAEWSALQVKLTDPERSTRKESAIRYLLTGFAMCGECGSRKMGTQRQRGNLNGGGRAYVCTDCYRVVRKVDDVDKHVTAKIIDRLSSPDLADLYGRAEGDAAATIAAARERAAELRARLTSIEDEAATGAISAAAFGRLEARLTAEIEQAEAEAQRATLPSTVRHLAGVDRVHVARVWSALTIVEKREALRALNLAVTIKRTGNGRRIFDPESVPVVFP